MRYLRYPIKKMKTIFISFIVILGAFSTITAQENKTITLTLEISITKYNKGSILLALYDSEESYMKEIYKSAEIFIRDNKAQIVFSALKKGVYAFTFFHDLNKNKELDTNFLGIPKEPYGFSNEKKGRFGPPKFEEISFTLNKSSIFKISIE